MLYNLIDSYRDYLQDKYTRETARTYWGHIKPLLKTQSINLTADNFDTEKVLDILADVKYKNNFAKYKNALFRFCEFLGIKLEIKHLNKIKELEKKTKKKYRKLKAIDFEAVNKKIKGLRNKKLRLSYQTMLATGLRVGELAGISKDDCLVSADEIHLYFIAKGGEPSTVAISKKENAKLFSDLIKLINATQHKIFYSVSYLQPNAKKLGFGCHDLRRIYARQEYQKTKSKEAVRIKLRHSDIKTTNIYLKNKIKNIKGGTT